MPSAVDEAERLEAVEARLESLEERIRKIMLALAQTHEDLAPVADDSLFDD